MSIKKLTLGAILSALGVVFLLLGSVIEPLDLSAAALAALVIYIGVIELNGFYPHMMYMTVGVLSLVLLPNKIPALVFVCFTGMYAILKSMAESKHNIIAWIVKMSYFNTVLTVMIYIGKNLFAIDDELFEYNPIIYLAGNAVFVLYDIAMTRLILLYLVKIRAKLKLKDYF